MKKYFAISNERFETMFTKEQQENVKSTLKAFNEVNVVYEYGKYNFSSALCLKAHYAPDYEFVGTVYADDIFTPEERILNYIESFHSYPVEYKGVKDFGMLREVEGNWDARFGYNENGTIVRIS